jgi:hypothetical protein
MIRLSWRAVDNATNYELEIGVGTYSTDNFDDSNYVRTSMTLAGTLTNYVHDNLSAGTRYTYRMRAVLPQGVNSAWTAVVLQYTKPMKPELTADQVDNVATSVELKWDAVEFVDENSDANHLTGGSTNYRVESRKSGESGWTAVDDNIECVAADNECSVTVDALDAESLYYFRIRATVARDGTTYNSYWDYANERTAAE